MCLLSEVQLSGIHGAKHGAVPVLVQVSRQAAQRSEWGWGSGEIKSPATRGPLGLRERLVHLQWSLLVSNNTS